MHTVTSALFVLLQSLNVSLDLLFQVGSMLLGAGLLIQRLKHVETQLHEKHEENKERRREDLAHIDEKFELLERSHAADTAILHDSIKTLRGDVNRIALEQGRVRRQKSEDEGREL